MKDVAIYTVLRILLFVGTAAVVFGVYSLFTERVVLLYVILIAALLTVPLSFWLLAGPRERVAQRLQRRAEAASAKFEEIKSREDAD